MVFFIPLIIAALKPNLRIIGLIRVMFFSIVYYLCQVVKSEKNSKKPSVREQQTDLLTAGKARTQRASSNPSPISWLEDSQNDSVFESGRTSQLVDKFER